MNEAAGWHRDAEDEGRERYWDGSGWTESVRPVAPAPEDPAPPETPRATKDPGAPETAEDPGAPEDPRTPEAERVPDHLPQLHRALAEAITDIDAVEARLSDLFERTDGRRTAAPATPLASERLTSSEPPVTDDTIDTTDTGDTTFADLDAELAAEEADDVDQDASHADDHAAAGKPAKRRLFRRRS